MDITLDEFQKYTGLTIEETRFQALLSHASSVLSKSFFEDQYPYALSLMVAHLNTLISRPYESGRDITELTVGDMSIKFSEQSMGELSSSRWGGLLQSLASSKTKYFAIVT
jgi:hypothetical protein